MLEMKNIEKRNDFQGAQFLCGGKNKRVKYQFTEKQTLIWTLL